MTIDIKSAQSRAAALVEQMRPFFAGNDPEVVGAALGELCATFIAGQHPDMRAEQRTLLLDVMDDLIPVIVEMMISQGRAPPWWRQGYS